MDLREALKPTADDSLVAADGAVAPGSVPETHKQSPVGTVANAFHAAYFGNNPGGIPEAAAAPYGGQGMAAAQVQPMGIGSAAAQVMQAEEAAPAPAALVEHWHQGEPLKRLWVDVWDEVEKEDNNDCTSKPVMHMGKVG